MNKSSNLIVVSLCAFGILFFGAVALGMLYFVYDGFKQGGQGGLVVVAIPVIALMVYFVFVLVKVIKKLNREA